MRWTCILLIALVGCTQKLDDELMGMRQQALNNEQLYAKAMLSFADAADDMARLKHTLQEDGLKKGDSIWIKEHTKDGQFVVDASEMPVFLGKRDLHWKNYAESKQGWAEAIKNFRQAVNDKRTFAEVIFSKEMDAQKAKDSFRAAQESLANVLIGAASTSAVALPLLIP